MKRKMPRLLALPRELRDEIYELVLFSQIPRRLSLVPVLKSGNGIGYETSILRINKQVHLEASSVLYKKITLIIPVKGLHTRKKTRGQIKEYGIYKILRADQTGADFGSRNSSPNTSVYPTPKLSPRGSILRKRLPPLWETHGLIDGYILRKIAEVQYHFAFGLQLDEEASLGMCACKGFSALSSIDLINALCKQDVSNGSGQTKSLWFDVYSINRFEMEHGLFAIEHGNMDVEEFMKEVEQALLPVLKACGIMKALRELKNFRTIVMLQGDHSHHWSAEMRKKMQEYVDQDAGDADEDMEIHEYWEDLPAPWETKAAQMA